MSLSLFSEDILSGQLRISVFFLPSWVLVRLHPRVSSSIEDDAADGAMTYCNREMTCWATCAGSKINQIKKDFIEIR